MPTSVRLAVPDLATIQALARDDMAAVDALIRKRLASEVVLINQVGEYIIGAGGKRLRPMLLLLASGALGHRGSDAHQLAAVVEFIHTATLLHDDVVDESSLRRGRQTANARELDSLSDVISFGVAPAALGYACGLQGGWDWIVLSYFVGCGVSRLARYNVTAEQLSGTEGKVKYFEGTPIPTSVVIVGLLALAATTGHIGPALWGGVWQLGPWQLHPLVLVYALSGSLMISKTLRIPKP